MKRFIIYLMAAVILSTSCMVAGEVFTRPKGDTRFRDLSLARQPLPSAELDNEFNTVKTFLNNSFTMTQNISEWALFQNTPTYVSTSSFTVTGDSSELFHVGRSIKADLNGTFVYSRIATSSYSSLTNKTTVGISNAVLTSSLTAIYYGLVSADGKSQPVFNNISATQISTGKTISTQIFSTQINADDVIAKGPVIDVRGFANLSTAKASSTTANKTLLIAGGEVSSNTVTISTDRSIKIERGGSINVASGKTLTMPVPAAGPYRIFTGTGTIAFADGAGEVIYPEWWGATGDGTTDDTAAFTACITAGLNKGFTVRLLPKVYRVGDIAIAGTGGVSPGTVWPAIEGTLDGSSTSATNKGTILKAITGATYIFKLGTATNFISKPTFRNLAFDGNSKATGGVWLAGTGYAHFEHVTFSACTYGIGITYADRMTTYKTNFYGNTYGYYYDSSVFTGTTAASGVSLVDNHHRSNDYNMYFKADRTTYQMVVRGGYWSSASIADVYVTGAASQLVFDGVNFENTTDAKIATKAAYFQFGQVNAGSHIGIDSVTIINCDIFDNNDVADRPLLMTVVDSTSSTNPSIRLLTLQNNRLRQLSTTVPLISESGSALGKGIWLANEAPGVTPPTQSTVWGITQLIDTVGAGNHALTNKYLYSSPIIRKVQNSASTTDFTTRVTEVDGIYTNEGVGGTKVYKLPAVTVGYSWTFTCLEASRAIRIDPQDDEGFLGGSGLGKYIEMSTAVGDTVRVTGVSTTKAKAWQFSVLRGTATNE